VTRPRLRPLLTTLTAGVVGLVAGAVLSLTVQSSGAPTRPDGGPPSTPPPRVVGAGATGAAAHVDASPVSNTTYLAWSPGGIPPSLGTHLRTLPGIDKEVVVASDISWMTRSTSADGQVVDEPKAPYAIPLEVIAVDPASYAPFLPQADRADVEAALAAGQGVLGQSSAELRQIGPGGTVDFGARSIRIAAVLPDAAVGASELMVSREVGARIGVDQARYALIQPRGTPPASRLGRMLKPFVPAGTPVQVRAPGDTPYAREADAVLPPVKIKQLFGEFAARPDPGHPGFLDVDPAWVRQNIEIRHLPLVGNIQCNKALFPQLRGALEELVRRGLGNLVHSDNGCYVPKFILNDPNAEISHHSWGMAFDINLIGNEYGQPPHQDPRLVRILAKWGFIWGGTFIIPDGNHFEYRRPAAPSTHR
jgi:D-alanyl-D-alanine carboxypeptidase